MKQYALSVVIPVYNGERWVERAVQSVLEQPCSQEIEIILVNDGSKDNSEAVCDQLQEKYSNVVAVHKPNGGVSSARNLGIEKAGGKYVAFLDCDDWWEKDFFDQEMLRVTLEEDYDLLQFAYKHVSASLRWEKVFPVQKGEFFAENFENGRLPCDWNPHWSYIYKTELLREENLRYPPAKVNEDQSFLDMCFTVAKSAKRINKVLYCYWKNSLSIMHTVNHMTHFDEAYKTVCALDDWYTQHGLKFDFDFSVHRFVAILLPGLVAFESYKGCKAFIHQDSRCAPIQGYKNQWLFPRDKRRITMFMEHPLLYWLYGKVVLKPIFYIKSVTHKLPLPVQKAMEAGVYKNKGYVRRKV